MHFGTGYYLTRKWFYYSPPVISHECSRSEQCNNAIKLPGKKDLHLRMVIGCKAVKVAKPLLFIKTRCTINIQDNHLIFDIHLMIDVKCNDIRLYLISSYQLKDGILRPQINLCNSDFQTAYIPALSDTCA